MKRLLILLIIFTITSFIFLKQAQSQDFDYEKSFQDYLYNYNLYRISHLDYVSAKNEYLTYKTLTSQTTALETTKKMLLNRDETIRTYLSALRMKLKETTGIINYQQNLHYIKLDDEISRLNNHKATIPSAATLDDLVKISTQTEEKRPDLEFLSYQVLGTIFKGRETSLRDKVKETIDNTETIINQMREAKIDTTVMERWLLEAKQKVSRSEEKQTQALSILSGMKTSEKDKQKTYNNAQASFEESNLYLKEAISNLKEIIREIKRA